MTDNRARQVSLAAIDKSIGAISKSASKLNEVIHATAIMCAEHAFTYGDTDQCARLVDALPMSYRRSLLIGWYEAFTPVAIAKDAKLGRMKGHLKGKTEERANMWNIEAGKATPFYAMPDAKNEPDVPTFESIHSNVVAFIKRIETKAGSIQNEDEKKRALEEVAALRKAVAAA